MLAQAAVTFQAERCGYWLLVMWYVLRQTLGGVWCTGAAVQTNSRCL